MYGTILVAFDGSEDAHRTLDHAVELAGTVDATLHVVTVVEPRDNPMKFGVVEVDELNRTEAALVDEIVAAHGVGDVEGVIRRGDPVEVLLEYTDEVDADLLVVGQDRTDGIEAAVFGRTADRLVRTTDVPLIVVPV
jgi:nucleotide-binding universal stress UspA family protein